MMGDGICIGPPFPNVKAYIYPHKRKYYGEKKNRE